MEPSEFSSNLKIYDLKTIKDKLGTKGFSIRNLYKKGILLLGEIENNFGDNLNKNGENKYSYFDGKVNGNKNKTDFEKKASELEERISLSIDLKANNIMESFARKDYFKEKLDELSLDIFNLQISQKEKIEGDLSDDGIINNESNISKGYIFPKIERNNSELSNAELNYKKNNSITEIITNKNTKFIFTPLKYYDPQTTNTKLQINDVKTGYIMNSNERNIIKTDNNKLKEFILDWLQKNKNISSKYNINHLTPKEAILLSSEIVGKQLKYSYELLIPYKYDKNGRYTGYDYSLGKKGGNNYLKAKGFKKNSDKIPMEILKKIKENPSNIYQMTDQIHDSGVDKLLQNGRGICTNYSQALSSVFEILKSIQIPDNSLLNNTYVVSGENKNTTSIEGTEIVGFHAWNEVYTILPNGETEETIIDVTWADDNNNFEINNLDYTNDRFIFTLDRFIEAKIITEEQKILCLEGVIKKDPLNNRIETFKKIIQSYRNTNPIKK